MLLVSVWSSQRKRDNSEIKNLQYLRWQGQHIPLLSRAESEQRPPARLRWRYYCLILSHLPEIESYSNVKAEQYVL